MWNTLEEQKLGAALSGGMHSKLSFEVNKFINADPSLLVDKHQLFKVLNAVNAILQIITGSGHCIVNQAVKPKATLKPKHLLLVKQDSY